MILKRLLWSAFAFLLVLFGACSDPAPSSEETPQSYVDGLDQALDELVAGLESSGSADDVEAVGREHWRVFIEALHDLSPPTGLVPAHSSLVEAADQLQEDSSKEGEELAEAFTDACREVEAVAIDLGAEASLACD